MIRILDVNESAAAATCEQIHAAGGTASAHLCDVTNQAEVKACFDELFREQRIHILINNAGISHIGTVESTTEARFRPRGSRERQGLLQLHARRGRAYERAPAVA